MNSSSDHKPVIFLDVDGVLNRLHRYDNGYCGTDPGCIREMNRVIRETDARLVITSSWRYLVLSGSMTTLGLENLLLTHGLDCRDRVIGCTPSDEMVSCRGPQIRSWMTAYLRFGQPYIVLDDGEEECRSIRSRSLNLVQTAGSDGLTPGDADIVIESLKAQARRYDQQRKGIEP